MAPPQTQPEVTFAVLADIQYADKVRRASPRAPAGRRAGGRRGGRSGRRGPAPASAARRPGPSPAPPRPPPGAPRPQDDSHFEGRTQRFREVPAKLAAAVDAILAEHAALAGAADSQAAASQHAALAARGPAPAAAPADAAAASAGRQEAAPAGEGPGAAAGGGSGGGASGGGGRGLAAALHLGDIIDGYAGDAGDAGDAKKKAAGDLELVLGHLSRVAAAGPPLRHVFGNHCFALPRAALLARLGFPAGSEGWYAAPLGPGWRLVVLDTTDVSLFGHEQVGQRGLEGAGVRARAKRRGRAGAEEGGRGRTASDLSLQNSPAGRAKCGRGRRVARGAPARPRPPQRADLERGRRRAPAGVAARGARRRGGRGRARRGSGPPPARAGLGAGPLPVLEPRRAARRV
jgi:hypothetical protein